MCNRVKAVLLGGVLASALASPAAMAREGYLAEVFLFAGSFCPRGTAAAEGQLLSISQFQSLFSLIGTTYGGDGRTTFALPDLRGRAPIGQGRPPGGADIASGQQIGLKGKTNPKLGVLAMRYCIVTEGIYPSRS